MSKRNNEPAAQLQNISTVAIGYIVGEHLLGTVLVLNICRGGQRVGLALNDSCSSYVQLGAYLIPNRFSIL